MTLSKKLSLPIIMIAMLAAMTAFAGVAYGHAPEECADIPPNDRHRFALCHQQSDPAGSGVRAEERFDQVAEADEGYADPTWERQYMSDPITTCIGVKIAAESLAFATVEDEIIDGPLVEAAARNRDCITLQYGWAQRVWVWFD